MVDDKKKQKKVGKMKIGKGKIEKIAYFEPKVGKIVVK